MTHPYLVAKLIIKSEFPANAVEFALDWLGYQLDDLYGSAGKGCDMATVNKVRSLIEARSKAMLDEIAYQTKRLAEAPPVNPYTHLQGKRVGVLYRIGVNSGHVAAAADVLDCGQATDTVSVGHKLISTRNIIGMAELGANDKFLTGNPVPIETPLETPYDGVIAKATIQPQNPYFHLEGKRVCVVYRLAPGSRITVRSCGRIRTREFPDMILVDKAVIDNASIIRIDEAPEGPATRGGGE